MSKPMYVSPSIAKRSVSLESFIMETDPAKVKKMNVDDYTEYDGSSPDMVRDVWVSI
jgi:hypothetical protein